MCKKLDFNKKVQKNYNLYDHSQNFNLLQLNKDDSKKLWIPTWEIQDRQHPASMLYFARKPLPIAIAKLYGHLKQYFFQKMQFFASMQRKRFSWLCSTLHISLPPVDDAHII